MHLGCSVAYSVALVVAHRASPPLVGYILRAQELAERLSKEEALRMKEDEQATRNKEYEQRFRNELGK